MSNIDATINLVDKYFNHLLLSFGQLVVVAELRETKRVVLIEIGVGVSRITYTGNSHRVGKISGIGLLQL